VVDRSDWAVTVSGASMVPSSLAPAGRIVQAEALGTATRPLPASKRCSASRSVAAPCSAGALRFATRAASAEMATPDWRANAFKAWPSGWAGSEKDCGAVVAAV